MEKYQYFALSFAGFFTFFYMTYGLFPNRWVQAIISSFIATIGYVEAKNYGRNPKR